MITLLRRIRQKLIGSGTLTKYLIYATGEILLVVIGILIALQVNNWNEERKLDREEEQTLIALNEDVTGAVNELKVNIRGDSLVADRIRILLTDGMERDSFLADPKVDSLMYSPLWSTISGAPVIQTYNDLKNSGKISVLQNREIREILVSLETDFIQINTQQKDLMTVQQIRVDELTTFEIDFVNVLESRFYPGLTRGEMNNYSAVFSDRTNRNILVTKMAIINFSLASRREILKECERLISIINSELQK